MFSQSNSQGTKRGSRSLQDAGCQQVRQGNDGFASEVLVPNGLIYNFLHALELQFNCHDSLLNGIPTVQSLKTSWLDLAYEFSLDQYFKVRSESLPENITEQSNKLIERNSSARPR